MSVTTARVRKNSGFRIFWRRFRHQKSSIACMCVVLLLVLASILAPVIAPYGYAEMNSKATKRGPSWQHPFGTDELGRDIFSRCLYGGRYSLAIGLFSTLIALAAGVVIGAVAAYFGGVADLLLMRLLDLLSSMPSVLLSIAVSAVLGTGFFKLLIALAIGAVPAYARQIRAKMLALRSLEYVEAAQAINCGTARVMFLHIVPNAMTPVIIAATMGMAQQMLNAATLAYIGLGVQPPTPEWGAMLNAAKAFIRKYPYMLVGPGLLIVASVLCFNLIGDGIRDAMDPRLKR